MTRTGSRQPNRRWDVLALGAVAVDDFLYVEDYPDRDSKERVTSTRRVPGGLAGTALVAAARYGARCAYIGVFGSDELSAFVRADLEKEGVDCSLCTVAEGASPFHTIAIADRRTGSRTLFVDGSGFHEPPTEPIDEALIADAAILLVDYTVANAARHSATLARAWGVPVVGDLEPDAGDEVEALLPLVDHLIIGVEMARRLAGCNDPTVAVENLVGRWGSTVVVTEGAGGCRYGSPTMRRPGQQPAMKVVPVDTNGCGDVFHGVYAAALAEGEAVETAIRYATVAAGLKAGRADGGRAGVPRRFEIEHYLHGSEADG